MNNIKLDSFEIIVVKMFLFIFTVIAVINLFR